jgi:hypothetical protein
MLVQLKIIKIIKKEKKKIVPLLPGGVSFVPG